MFKLILLLILNLFGFNNYQSPARLGRKLTLTDKFLMWINIHHYELLVIAIFLGMVIFALVLFMVVPAMDPYTNHFQEVV